MKRLTMRKIREAVRLHASGLSTRKIAASLGVGQSTASEYVKRVEAAGFTVSGVPVPLMFRLRSLARWHWRLAFADCQNSYELTGDSRMRSFSRK